MGFCHFPGASFSLMVSSTGECFSHPTLLDATPPICNNLVSVCRKGRQQQQQPLPALLDRWYVFDTTYALGRVLIGQ